MTPHILYILQALYALGNTSLALKEQTIDGTFVTTIKDIFLSVCACLDDCDDKVCRFDPISIVLPPSLLKPLTSFVA